MGKADSNRKLWRRALASGHPLAVIGAYDALSAMLVQRAGFPAVYIGSYTTSAARLGMPDVGIVTMEEMAADAKAIVDAVDIPVLADGENGWNNAANIWRTVRAFEQAGVVGIHLEDRVFGKHMPLPSVLTPCRDMVEKIRAALDAREDENFLIIARTDAASARGDIDDAVERMNAYTEAGADLVMTPAIDLELLTALRPRVKGKLVIADTPGRSVADDERAGADVVIYYGFTLFAAFHGVKSALAAFKRTRNADEVPHLRGSIDEFEEFIGFAGFAARARKYGLG
jgi:2-methylisocitrate lyase-like PEP mutase family enzyme